MNPILLAQNGPVPPAPGGRRILNVNGDTALRHSLTRMLVRQGFAVSEAETSAAALLEIRREPPDLVLLNDNRADGNPAAVLDSIRRAAGATHLPIILISAPRAEEGSPPTEPHSGADACLAWPVPDAVLEATIRAFLRTREAECRLRDAEARWHATVEQAAIGLGHLSLEGAWTWANSRLCQIFGYSQQEVLGRHCADMLAPENRQSWIELQRRLLCGQSESVATELPCRRKDGSDLWASFTVSVARDLEGRPRHLVAVVDDINIRKWTEANLSRIRAAIEGASEAIAIHDVEGCVTYVNRAFSRLFGRGLEGLPGPWPTLSLFADAAVGRAVCDRLARHQAWEGEPEMRGAQGRSLRVELRAHPIRDEQGAVIGFISLHKDVTQQRELEASFRRAQRLEALGRLSGGVAHDFNNLLTVMRGNAELLLMSSDLLPREGVDLLHNILNASDSAAKLTRQLLIFSRRQALQPQAVNLNEVVKGLAKMLRRVIREDIQMECVQADGLPFVFADPAMLEQVLMNLVVNARDAMPHGGHLRIATESLELDAIPAHGNPDAPPGRFVCLRVSDTGIGILPDKLSRIFEPFYTTKEAGQGTGLGLATVDSIARQHRGWVEVSSRVGEGSEFRVYLPAIASATGGPSTADVGTALPRGSESILLVEDEEAVRMITRQVLTSLGYRVHEAASGQEALETWEQRKGEITLLLSDMVLPDGLTGRDLARKFRTAKAGLKILLTSGYGPDTLGQDTAFFRQSGVSFLRKPASAPDLAHAVRQCLDEKEPNTD